MTRYITFLVLQLNNCLGFGMSIENLCLKVVHSAKHLVSNKGAYCPCIARGSPKSFENGDPGVPKIL